MTSVCSFAVAAAILGSMPSGTMPTGPGPLARASAIQAQPQKPEQKPEQQPQPKPEQKPEPKPEQKPEETPKYEETVVVSASRTEEKLVDAPATMSVITGAAIEIAPTRNFAELLRAVPGVNVTQISARDINITTRNATGTLATGQLALLDGRSLYQDFFGFVMWDFLPVNFNEVKQIEVIRGPASAVWGANALNGVVNVITKAPREMQGTSAVVGFGGFSRANDEDAGALWYVSGTHAQAVNDRWAYKLSAGGYSQDPLSRPTGVIPCDAGPELCGARQELVSAVHQSGHDAAQVRRPGRLRLRGRPQALVLGRHLGHRRHHAHGDRSVRHPERHGHGLRQGQLLRPRLPRELLHQYPERRREQPADR